MLNIYLYDKKKIRFCLSELKLKDLLQNENDYNI